MKSPNQLLFAVLLTSAACTPLKMGVPADLAKEADLISVTDRSRMSGALANETFKMGPYETASIDRKWNSGSSNSIFGFQSNAMKTGYAFTFKGPRGEAKVQCGSEAQSKGGSIAGFDFSSTLDTIGCVCDGAGGSSKLNISASTGDAYGGQVTTRSGSYTVAAVMKYENGMQSHDPVGFEFRANTTVAAIELAHPGRLWLAKSLDEATRDDLACLSAGLLLYQKPKQE